MLPVVILAGGLGTRMRPQTEEIPKSLLLVNGRQFAVLQLERLVREGVQQVIYCIGYRGALVRDALGDGTRFGVRIDYVDEGDDLRGTAGALRLALDRGTLPEAFFVLNGDSYLSANLKEVENAWRRSASPALMTVFRNNGLWDHSNVVLRDGRVLYDKRHPMVDGQPMEWIDYGLSILTREAIADGLPAGAHADLADLLHELSVRGCVAGFEAKERFYEVGSPAGLQDLQELLGETG